jgi:hypothetical protein
MEVAMDWAWTYWLENTGNFTTTVQMGLDPSRSYVVEGFLTKKGGGDYGHVYIAEVCTQPSPDQVLCGVNDEGSSGIVTVLSGAISVTVGLHTTGGNHRAEGVIYVL